MAADTPEVAEHYVVFEHETDGLLGGNKIKQFA